MSTPLINHGLIDVLLSAVDTYGDGKLAWLYGPDGTLGHLGYLDRNFDAVGQMLVDTNATSINIISLKTLTPAKYTYVAPETTYTPVQILRAIEDYESASMHHIRHCASTAAFCGELRNLVIRYLPNYYTPAPYPVRP